MLMGSTICSVEMIYIAFSNFTFESRLKMVICLQVSKSRDMPWKKIAQSRKGTEVCKGKQLDCGHSR